MSVYVKEVTKMAYVMSLRYYVQSAKTGGYWGGITTDHRKAEQWLAEAQSSRPDGEWGIYNFYD